VLPDFIRHPDPLLPRNADDLQWEYPEWAAALRARGVGDPARTWPAAYLRRWGTPVPGWEPRQRFVVTASHPAVLSNMNPPVPAIVALHFAHARVVAEFRGVPDPLPAGVVYDRREADYLPLAGFGAVARPGPNITIWEVPPR
jgi:hypothetical protein